MRVVCYVSNVTDGDILPIQKIAGKKPLLTVTVAEGEHFVIAIFVAIAVAAVVVVSEHTVGTGVGTYTGRFTTTVELLPESARNFSFNRLRFSSASFKRVTSFFSAASSSFWREIVAS